MGKSSSDINIPTYWVGLHFVLCAGPIDQITEIRVDKKVAWLSNGMTFLQDGFNRYFPWPDNGDGRGGLITIHAATLFGGNTREGGILGPMSIDMGELTQVANDYLTTAIGSAVPAFRGVVSAIFRQGYVGTNYYLKSWAFKGTRVHKLTNGSPQWLDAYAELNTTLQLPGQVLEITYYYDTGINYAWVIMSQIHGMAPGSSFTISGVTGPDASLYNGSFVVQDSYTDGNRFSYIIPMAPTGSAIQGTNGNIIATQHDYGLINAVHVLRECLTNNSWGYGYDGSTLYSADWQAAAITCYTEKLGFGFLWETEGTLQDFITEVLRHIQASLYRDRTDGLWHIQLIRKITDTTGLLVLNEANTRSITSFARKSLGELVSTVNVKFLDNFTWENNVCTISDLSLQQRQGIPISKEIEYSGVTSMEMAQKLAIRDLNQLSIPLYNATIHCNRDAENLYIGQAFILDWPDYINTPIVMRVVSLDLGTPTKGEITIEALQDNFSAADTIYYTSPGSSWIDPISLPSPVPYRLFIEAPYYLVAKEHGDVFAQAVDPTVTYISIAGVSPTPDALHASINSKTTGAYVKYGLMDFCFTATISTGLDRIQTSVTYTNEIDIILLYLNSFVVLGNEFIQVTGIDTSTKTLTLVRGVLDTIPEVHTIGDRLFGYQDFHSSDNVTYVLGESVTCALTTITAKGELNIANANSDSLTTVGRLHRPYPPANFKINTLYWPASIPTGTITLEWFTRNRIQQTAGLLGYYAPSVTTETGVTYSGTLTRTDTSAIIYSWTAEAVLTKVISTGYVGQVLLEVWSEHPTNGHSFYKVSYTFNLT